MGVTTATGFATFDIVVGGLGPAARDHVARAGRRRVRRASEPACVGGDRGRGWSTGGQPADHVRSRGPYRERGHRRRRGCGGGSARRLRARRVSADDHRARAPGWNREHESRDLHGHRERVARREPQRPLRRDDRFRHHARPLRFVRPRRLPARRGDLRPRPRRCLRRLHRLRRHPRRPRDQQDLWRNVRARRRQDDHGACHGQGRRGGRSERHRALPPRLPALGHTRQRNGEPRRIDQLPGRCHHEQRVRSAGDVERSESARGRDGFVRPAGGDADGDVDPHAHRGAERGVVQSGVHRPRHKRRGRPRRVECRRRRVRSHPAVLRRGRRARRRCRNRPPDLGCDDRQLQHDDGRERCFTCEQRVPVRGQRASPGDLRRAAFRLLAGERPGRARGMRRARDHDSEAAPQAVRRDQRPDRRRSARPERPRHQSQGHPDQHARARCHRQLRGGHRLRDRRPRRIVLDARRPDAVRHQRACVRCAAVGRPRLLPRTGFAAGCPGGDEDADARARAAVLRFGRRTRARREYAPPRARRAAVRTDAELELARATTGVNGRATLDRIALGYRNERDDTHRRRDRDAERADRVAQRHLPARGLQLARHRRRVDAIPGRAHGLVDRPGDQLRDRRARGRRGRQHRRRVHPDRRRRHVLDQGCADRIRHPDDTA